jgi:GNAT superfamily N-acetyltransferase
MTAATPDDAMAVAGLLEEMDRFYGATDTEPIAEQLRQINEALFGDVPAAYALLAWDESHLVGLAAYSFLWPAVGLTQSLYLKELYVSQAHRRRGIGAQLMRGISEVAAKRQSSRVEWTTDRDNPGAQQFYAAQGYETCGSKVFYRVEADGQ